MGSPFLPPLFLQGRFYHLISPCLLHLKRQPPLIHYFYSPHQSHLREAWTVSTLRSQLPLVVIFGLERPEMSISLMKTKLDEIDQKTTINLTPIHMAQQDTHPYITG